MFILKGMEEAVSNQMSVILVHLTTCGRNSEPAEQRAVGTVVRHRFIKGVGTTGSEGRGSHELT